jgi:exonuclease III
MTAEFRGISMINIYAPSGTAKRREREHFYNNELAYLLRDTPTNILLGGDFNCVLETGDTTHRAGH